jgi:hypothetical protein
MLQSGIFERADNPHIVKTSAAMKACQSGIGRRDPASYLRRLVRCPPLTHLSAISITGDGLPNLITIGLSHCEIGQQRCKGNGE